MNLSEIQIDSKALIENYRSLRSLISPQEKVAVVVKGNAYGHGLDEVCSVLEPYADYFQVDDLDELLRVRAVSHKRVLVLGYVPRCSLPEVIAFGAELGLFDMETLGALVETGLPAKVHIKVDALLGRLGTLPSQLDALIEELAKHPQIEVRGVYAHFANIEDTTDLTHALAQAEVFDEAAAKVRARYPIAKRHISATSGAMTVEQDNARDLVRLGIGIYGLYPSAPLARTHSDVGLKPVLRWVTHLAQVKELPAKHPVGYGLTYVTPRPMRIGIVPQGYSDGFDRGLSNSGDVLVGGRRCPVLGRVAMNMFAVDLSAVPEVKTEDEVVLLGGQGQERIDAEEIATKLGTINYEVTSRICPLLPRIVTPIESPVEPSSFAAAI